MWWGWAALVAVTVALMAADHWLAVRGRLLAAVFMSLLVAVAFAAVVGGFGGSGQAVDYLAAYGAERLLSVDNVVALLAVIGAFGLSQPDRDRVFVWGVNTALVLRVGLVLAGVGLIEALWWSEPVLGTLLAVGGVQLARHAQGAKHEAGLAERIGGRLARGGSSTMFVAVAGVVITDAVFAVDSVPTVVAFAPDPFPAVSAAVLSVLGLRPLGVLIGGWVARLRYLQPALGAVLVVVGVKLAMTPLLEVPDLATLAIVAALITAGIVASVLRPDPDDPELAAGPAAPSSRPVHGGTAE